MDCDLPCHAPVVSVQALTMKAATATMSVTDSGTEAKDSAEDQEQHVGWRRLVAKAPRSQALLADSDDTKNDSSRSASAAHSSPAHRATATGTTDTAPWPSVVDKMAAHSPASAEAEAESVHTARDC